MLRIALLLSLAITAAHAHPGHPRLPLDHHSSALELLGWLALGLVIVGAVVWKRRAAR